MAVTHIDHSKEEKIDLSIFNSTCLFVIALCSFLSLILQAWKG